MIEAEEHYYELYGSQDTEPKIESDALSLDDLFKGSYTNKEVEEVEEHDLDTASLIAALEELDIGLGDVEEPQTERRIQVDLSGNIVASQPSMMFNLNENLIEAEAKQANDSDRLDAITKNGYTVSIDLNEGKVVAYFEKEDAERIGVCGRDLSEAIDMFYTMTGRVI